ncbi:glycine C-acetyltransferase [Cephaloticoccus capnophilus]|uniref:2-amino-3-ketobutyrate coenzyme A ligase n=1 Tax=Cephaloticoccus capnophilus TaxID=1548208 RepID=A0A139SHP3_9BACT|nr:glycine C-acetyltransferase [Cephaloticoccus capnophilus]KXU34000.1 glycine C-acetyltransferase [Cephaloticoccus capnophilus]
MLSPEFKTQVSATLAEIDTAGTTKRERLITTPQAAQVQVAPPYGTMLGATKSSASSDTPHALLNLCANNYLGLANHPELVAAAHAALDRWGYGLASVRFICGTQTLHRDLEAALSHYLGMEDTILYASCFDANGGLFETLLGPEDAILSDALNHASIIDGVRLCRARRYRYQNNDLADLEAKLREADANGARHKLIATDGVFSMDGTIADLRGICDLAERYGALVMVDDSHAVGVIGANGRGTPEHCGVEGRVDILTGTLGKALGGASGGYTSARREIVELLRQRSRPYLFSNTLPPVVAAASLKALELLTRSGELRARLAENTRFFREQLSAAGFTLLPGTHPITPVMLGDAALAQRFADRLLGKGIYVVGFSYPVVPLGKARIRVQVSAVHSRDELAHAVQKFTETKAELGAH